MTKLPLPALARSLARHMGHGWTAAPDRDWPNTVWELRLHDGRRIGLQLDTGRLLAEGRLPDAPDDVTPYTSSIDSGSIRMSAAKTPTQLAADITRRLMPTLDAAHAEWHNRVAVMREQEAQRTAAAEQLARVPGLSVPKRGRWLARTETAYALSWKGPARAKHPDATPSARVWVDAGTVGAHVRMELSGLTADQAESILRALTDPALHPAPSDGQGSARTAAEPHDS